jgi:Fe-Mn family superoxide dismutase
MFKFIKYVTLTEAQEPKTLTQTPLPYGRNDLGKSLSKSSLDYHYGQLYKGYVDRYNKGEGDRTFNEAGAYLHSIFFAQLKSPAGRAPKGTILTLIQRNHKNFVDFKKAFKEEAMKLQGSGWIYLSKNGQIKTIKNHAKRTDIALLVDMWEHAFNLDYGSNKAKYLDSIWRLMDWDAINRRL